MTPHKHREVIKAWADGAEIETRMGGSEWLPCEEPHWYLSHDYRVKPKTIKYRVALLRNIHQTWVSARSEEASANDLERDTNFIRWLNDWTEAEV